MTSADQEEPSLSGIKRFQVLLADLRRNRRSGAHHLAQGALAVYRSFLQTGRRAPPETFLRRLRCLNRKIFSAQPAMASVQHVATRMETLAQRASRRRWSFGRLHQALRHETHRLIHQLRLALPRMARWGPRILRNAQTVLTHSASASVTALLRAAWESGRRFEVWVPRSLPGGEGEAFASFLAKTGIRCRLLSDREAVRFAPRADLFLVGADRVTPRFFVNKTGTRRLAKIFRRSGHPVYVACDRTKFSVRAGPYNRRLFEPTPTAWVRAFLTDGGILRKDR